MFNIAFQPNIQSGIVRFGSMKPPHVETPDPEREEKGGTDALHATLQEAIGACENNTVTNLHLYHAIENLQSAEQAGLLTEAYGSYLKKAGSELKPMAVTARLLQAHQSFGKPLSGNIRSYLREASATWN